MKKSLQSVDPVSPVQVAADLGRSRIMELVIDPRELVTRELSFAAEKTYPNPAREAEAATWIKQLVANCSLLIPQGDMMRVRAHATEFHHEINRLAAPLPEVSFDDRLRDGIADRLSREFSYAGLEIEGLRLLAKRDDRIEEINVSYVVLSGGRKITRAEMREATRPRFVEPSSRRWREQMGALEQAEQEAINRIAARDGLKTQPELYSSGPEHLIGTPIPKN